MPSNRSFALVAGIGVLALSSAAALPAASSAMAQSAKSVPTAPERVAVMRHHFSEVLQIHDAVIRGDLAAVRGPAARLGEIAIPPAMPATQAAPFVESVRAAGRRAAAATTVASAAQATASMVTECANCHRSVGVFPSPATPRAPEVGGLVGHMLEHQRAADEMLEALVIPSASRWRIGAERLRATALQPRQLPRDPKLTAEVRQAEADVHKLAGQAIAADTVDSRVSTYVQLLTACAKCHSLRKVWGPKIKSPS